MVRRTGARMLAVCGLVVAAAGCGPIVIGGTYKSEMEETVVDSRDGWWVINKIAIIDLDGQITDSDSSGLLGSQESTVALVGEQLKLAEDDWQVKAVVVRINSPGGGVTASDILYHELRAFRERTGKPVVVCVTDMGASGGYYAALGGDCIIAHPTSIVGSIGVIMQLVNLEGLLGKIGVTSEAIKSGDKKDIGSPLRQLTDEERALLQRTINSLYRRFVTLVAERRERLDEPAVRALADGRVFTADDALANGLIDEIGYMSDAVEKAKALAGIRHARLVAYHRPLGYKATVYALAEPRTINLLNIDVGKLIPGRRPVFLYLWAPGR